MTWPLGGRPSKNSRFRVRMEGAFCSCIVHAAEWKEPTIELKVPRLGLTAFWFGSTLTVAQIGLEYEPISDDFEGSSTTVSVGAEEVPGLMEALSE